MRHQRRPDEIVPLEHYMKLSMLCTQLPEEIEHVVFVSTVPVVYPHVKVARTVLNLLKNGLLRCLLGSLGAKQLNQFGEPELMDDLDDHWSAPDHRDERRFLIEILQMLSKYRGCRVTLLSGDVHVCGAGKLISYPEPSEEMLRHDFRYMPQVISSAISNPPPPGGLITMLDFCSHGGRINRATRHTMTRELRTRTGVRVVLENKRNWCEVNAEKEDGGHALIFKLRVEVGGISLRVRVRDRLVLAYEPGRVNGTSCHVVWILSWPYHRRRCLFVIRILHGEREGSIKKGVDNNSLPGGVACSVLSWVFLSAGDCRFVLWPYLKPLPPLLSIYRTVAAAAVIDRIVSFRFLSSYGGFHLTCGFVRIGPLDNPPRHCGFKHSSGIRNPPSCCALQDSPGDLKIIKQYDIKVPPLQKLNGQYYDTRTKHHGGCFVA
ncbi:hypothetical protein Vretifemale_10798 [Volvox reticuliferus]|nr:hypothetical protein Vretifemale_10798 [Volvox reticuliferus]